MNMNFMERARAERAQPNAAPKAGPHWGKLTAAALLSTPPKVSSRRRWARVGDTVIVVTAKGDPLNQSTRLFVGQTGVLITDDLNEPRIRPYQVRFPNGQNLWFRADEIRLHLEDTPRERASDGLLSRPAASPSEPPPPMRRRLTLMAPLGSHFWDRKRGAKGGFKAREGATSKECTWAHEGSQPSSKERAWAHEGSQPPTAERASDGHRTRTVLRPPPMPRGLTVSQLLPRAPRRLGVPLTWAGANGRAGVKEPSMDQYKHEYTKIFAAFDKDGSGTISTKELGDVMNTLGALLSAEELDTIVREVDADDSGQIDFDEFCTCMAKAKEKAGGEASGEKRWSVAEAAGTKQRLSKTLDPRQRLRKTLNAPKSSYAATALGLFIIATIIVSVFSFFLTTVPRFERSESLYAIEVACGIIFTIELALRTYVATLDLRNMLVLNPMYWIDVATIIPFYIDIFMAGRSRSSDGLLVLELLELLRLARIFKLLKHYSGWRVLLIALENSYRALMVYSWSVR